MSRVSISLSLLRALCASCLTDCSPCAGDALDPPLWKVPNKALSLVLSLSLARSLARSLSDV
jgi:hypothetical protein